MLKCSLFELRGFCSSTKEQTQIQHTASRHMQISEMRTLRAFYHHNELLNLIKSKFIQNPSFFPSTSTKNGRLFFHCRSADRKPIHFSNRRHGRELSSDVDGPRGFCSSNSLPDELGSSSGDENRRVWTTYDPVSGTLVTGRTFGEAETPEKESTSSGDEKPTSLSSFDSLETDFLPQRSVRAVKKPEEKSSGDGRASAWSSSPYKGEKSVPKKIENRERENSTFGYGTNLNSQNVVFKKKKGKNKMCWVCSNCGQSFGQWWGTCLSCRTTGTLKEFSVAEDVESKTRGFDVSENATRSWLQQKPGELHPQRLTDVNKGINQLAWRISLSGLFGAEVARVLGGGLVPGSLVLVGGDPGVGKSTLLLQIAAMLAEGPDFGGPAPVIYVSGEESVEQIGNRADRMRIGTEQLFLYSSTDIEDILEKIQLLSPRALIVDSIQTVYLRGVTGSAGGLSQVKECTSALLRFAKKTNIPVLLIGHVTKTGDIAGPRVLEHIVDVVLYLEGEKYSAHRFLRSVKNRFGSTDELGVFEMAQSGLQVVSNPSEIFLSEQHFDSEVLAGLAVAVIIDGSRTFLIEIQALCLSDSSVGRHVNGVQQSRADMIISVLIKQAGLKLQNNAIFINVVSGVTLEETAGDLAIAAAICSSFLEVPIPSDIAFIGELGLGGELRPVPRMEKRAIAVAKLGYKKCLVPKSAEKCLATLGLEGIMILGCRNLKDVIDAVF